MELNTGQIDGACQMTSTVDLSGRTAIIPGKSLGSTAAQGIRTPDKLIHHSRHTLHKARTVNNPSKQLIERWLTYSSEQKGMFFWKRSPNTKRIAAGDVAGTITPKGMIITLEGKRYRAAALSWVLAYNTKPPVRIAYKDNDCFNILPENLKAFKPLTEEELKRRRKERNEQARIKRWEAWRARNQRTGTNTHDIWG